MEEARLSMEHSSYQTRPSSLLNSIFMSTVNTAAKSLVTVASSSSSGHVEKWKPIDHLRYMVMLTIWLTVWILRILMDHFPCSVVPSPCYLLDGIVSIGSYGGSSLSSSSSSMSPLMSSSELVLDEGLVHGFDGSSSSPAKAVGRALSHIFGLINEIPVTSRKYQFAVTMADKIVDENAKDGRIELLEINRTVLSFAFEHTCTLLNRSLQKTTDETSTTWPTRFISTVPLGSYAISYLKGILFCFTSLFLPVLGEMESQKQQQQQLGISRNSINEGGVLGEKLAQELLWITNKLRACAAVDEALVQWSLASGLASLSLTANPRVQGSIIKISAILFQELARSQMEVPRQVKFRMLVLWLPLFCYASNGLAYPILTSLEKAETERVMEEVISSLPTMDQEIILTNWLHDFSFSTSDWPNLQSSFDRWCRSSRKLVCSNM